MTFPDNGRGKVVLFMCAKLLSTAEGSSQIAKAHEQPTRCGACATSRLASSRLSSSPRAATCRSILRIDFV